MLKLLVKCPRRHQIVFFLSYCDFSLRVFDLNLLHETVFIGLVDTLPMLSLSIYLSLVDLLLHFLDGGPDVGLAFPIPRNLIHVLVHHYRVRRPSILFRH